MRGEDSCCDDVVRIVSRHIIADISTKIMRDHIRGASASGQNIIEYKALSRRNGNTRRKTVLSEYGEILFKANVLRQIGSSIASYLTPGDLSPLRSPGRSAAYRAITPGLGGGRGGSRPGENRAHRCPEGYQYGGRFTDNRFSTCGQQLFDIPSALGAAIGAARRATTSGLPSRTTGTPITGGVAASNLIQSRAPQIPRVGNENRNLRNSRVNETIKAMGEFAKKSNIRNRRMVRRDGFVLEPVVPNSVLRAIPDNRDMEGASYLMTALASKDIGGEELGLLSNTGIKSLIYVLPGGSTIVLEKARQLEVGERRKLGRTVNTAQQIPNANDPSARLRNVAEEIGEGLSFTENFVNIKNPNEKIGKSPKWVSELWGNRKNIKSPGETGKTSRQTETFSARRRLITNLEEAIQHVVEGGSLGDISPEVLAQVLQKSRDIKIQKLSNKISAVTSGSSKYFLYRNPEKYQHISERFASDIQQMLGMESPDVLFAGKPGDKRQYLRQDVEEVIPGSRFNPDAKFEQLMPQDVARMMVSDFLTDQRERPMTSIYALETPDGLRGVLAENVTSGLIDLSKIEITKRMKMRIEDFYNPQATPSYSEYYRSLKAEQRILFIKLINQLIQKARTFNPKSISDDLGRYGMSEGEKIHLNIVTKLFETRLDVLSSQKNVLRSIVRGE